MHRMLSAAALIGGGGGAAPDWATEGMPTYLQSTASCEFYSFLLQSSSPHASTIMDRHAVNVWEAIRWVSAHAHMVINLWCAPDHQNAIKFLLCK